MIEVRKGQDRIPCDANANLEMLVQTHGADSVLVDGVSVAEIAERATEAAEVAIEAVAQEPAAASPEVADNIVAPGAEAEAAPHTVPGSVAQDPANFNPVE